MNNWKKVENDYRKCNQLIKGIRECRYYASDLNKFVGVTCTREMTVNNIDLIMYKYGKNKLRIIESKHQLEGGNKHQDNILKLLSSAKIENNEVEVYKICGNPPYEIVDILFVNDNEACLQVKQEQLIKFLNFEVEFKDLKVT